MPCGTTMHHVRERQRKDSKRTHCGVSGRARRPTRRTEVRRYQEWLIRLAGPERALAGEAEDGGERARQVGATSIHSKRSSRSQKEMQQAIQNKDRIGLHVAKDETRMHAKSEEVRIGVQRRRDRNGSAGVPKPPPGERRRSR